jgi:hypothetical protein
MTVERDSMRTARGRKEGPFRGVGERACRSAAEKYRLSKTASRARLERTSQVAVSRGPSRGPVSKAFLEGSSHRPVSRARLEGPHRRALSKGAV